MADGKVVFEISADGRKATAAINDITEALKKAGNKWESDAGKTTENVGNKFTDMFKKIGVAALAMKAGKALLDFGRDAIQAASDLEEVQNVVDVTFGDGARQIEAWAKTAGDQFGLTETQAKRFTSTLGAMMKSAGMAGPEIVGMSTDLAGLAADMASFYNLDFDTAFQKIRSGISGETEPLKQLGINMSVVNLEAFALTQGITKAFSEMSQGEQTMLRYQYLMQATADAQGDFARTSDGFANSQRRLQTAIDNIKTALGKPMLDVIADATGALSGFISLLVPKEKQKTVLDDLNDIKIERDQKLADIQAIATKAGDLINALEGINNTSGLNTDSDAMKYIETLTKDINALAGETAKQPTITGEISSLAGGLNPDVSGDGELAGSVSGIVESVGSLEKTLDTNDVAGKMDALAGDLNPDIGETTAEKKLGEVEGSIGSLEDTLSRNTVASGMESLAGDLNPEVQGDFAGTVSGITQSIGELETAVADTGTMQQDIEGVADAVNKLPGDSSKGDAVGAVAEGINKLKVGQGILWRSMYNVLSDIDGLSGIFNGNAAGNVSALATALSEDAPAEDKAKAWETFLDALGTNAGALKSLTGKDAEGAAEWLTTVKDALDQAKLDPENVAAWTNLMGVFAEGLSEENKGKFSDSVVQELLAMGSQSDYAREQLLALGFTSDDIASAQGQWLIICQRLVKELPGLSSIINTQTGEIEGGTQAVEDYLREWKAAQEEAIFLEEIAKKREVLEEHYADRNEKQVNLALKKAEYERRLREYNEMVRKVQNGEIEKTTDLAAYMLNEKTWLSAAPEAIKAMEDDYLAYIADYERAMEIFEEDARNATAAFGADAAAKAKAAAATEELTENMSTLAKAAKGDATAMASVKNAVTTLQDAMIALGDYQQKVRDETATTLRQTIRGFEEVVSPATKARNEVESLTAAISKESDAEKKAALERKLEAAKSTANAAPSFQTMQNNLDSQLKFMKQYNDELAAARAAGVSADILAQFSDGSTESFDYLYALNHSLEGLSDDERRKKIEELNETYKAVQDEAENLTNTLADQKLAADAEFKSLVQSVQDAVAGLDLGDTTYKYVEETLQGIIDACGDKEASLAAAVDSIKRQMVRLGTMGFGANLSMGGNVRFRNTAVFSYASPHANGIDYVPYDGYLALLHQGERIQTAAEADLSRRYANQQPGVDYAAAGAAMGAAMPRGNVYMDGRTVGTILSDRQANSYRALERSGWQG